MSVLWHLDNGSSTVFWHLSKNVRKAVRNSGSVYCHVLLIQTSYDMSILIMDILSHLVPFNPVQVQTELYFCLLVPQQLSAEKSVYMC